MQAEIDWLQQLGTDEDEVGNSVVVDGDNNYIYATGYNTSSDSSIGWVRKFYAKSGEQIWSTLLSNVTNTDDSEGRYIAVDDNNVYVLLLNKDSNKTLVTKLDLETGEEIWTYNFEYVSGAVDTCCSIVTDGNGSLYVTGYVNGSMLSPDGEALTSTGSPDVWIAKLSTDKELNWIEQLGSSGSKSYSMDLAVDSSSNVYAVGYTTGVMPDTGASNDMASEDIWIAKYNSDGERKWIKQFGSTNNQKEEALSVAVDESGCVYATGITYGDLQGGTDTEYYSQQSWVAKFQARDGEQVWLNQFGDEIQSDAAPDITDDSFGVRMRGISVDNNGSVYIGGRTNGQLAALSSDPVATTSTSRDGLIVKYNAYTGKQVWLKQINSSEDELDNVKDITIGPNGNIYLVGTTAGTISEIDTSQGGNDIWLAQLREVPDTNDELAQILKRYIDYKVSQSTETVLEASDTTTTTTNSISDTSSSLLEVAADVVASDGNTDEDEESTAESPISVIGVVASLTGSES
ncbi:MAG: PQQ-binding-like beta-propeller repeat protein [Symploca sp. SIO1B1]|nr:PQQ-binding-like beta-propeller repeat protein [Symploca sp. SIO1B1]